jgi:hypothetical protein
VRSSAPSQGTSITHASQCDGATTLQKSPHAIAERAIPIVGFSDGTALLAACARAGVASVHGPVVTQMPALPPADHQAVFALLEDSNPRILRIGVADFPDLFHGALFVQPVRHGDGLAVIGQRNIFVAQIFRGLRHLFDRVAAVGFDGVHMDVALQVGLRDERGQGVFFGGIDFAAAAGFNRAEPNALVRKTSVRCQATRAEVGS